MSFSFNPLDAARTVALASVTGGTSLVVSQIVQQVASQIGQQLIQQLGSQMGLPQGTIDMAQGAFAGSVGDVGGAFQNYQEAGDSFAQQFFPNASASERGEIQSGQDTIRQSIADWIAKGSGVDDNEGRGRGAGAGRSGGGSWLMALAAALGHQLDAAQNKLENTMNSTNWEKAGDSAKFQAMSQEFALFMNSATNVLKTVGESLSTMARKQ